MSDYDRIASAIHFIQQQADRQPALEEIAAHVQLSPYHFQRLFSRWTGISPKRFLQVLTVERGKQRLVANRALLEVADAIGLSSSSRLYDHFVQLEAATPGDFKRRGQGLLIEYGVHPSPFGSFFVAISSRGVCRAAFLDASSQQEQLAALHGDWPLATVEHNPVHTRQVVADMFGKSPVPTHPLSLYVAGTNFQIAVWRALLRIPPGSVTNYAQLATELNRPRSARAVGNAIAANPIAFLIPCHRVIRQTGAVGKYRWGETRKQALQIWETARVDNTLKKSR